MKIEIDIDIIFAHQQPRMNKNAEKPLFLSSTIARLQKINSSKSLERRALRIDNIRSDSLIIKNSDSTFKAIIFVKASSIFSRLPSTIRIYFKISNFRENSLFLNNLNSMEWRILDEDIDVIKMERVGLSSLNIFDILSEISMAWNEITF